MAADCTVTVQVGLELPTLPNFLRLAATVQPNAYAALSVDVASLPDDALREVGRCWTEALVEHAAKRRANEEGNDDA